jgi:hypothetical protein
MNTSKSKAPSPREWGKAVKYIYTRNTNYHREMQLLGMWCVENIPAMLALNWKPIEQNSIRALEELSILSMCAINTV